jgi:hypothetical protein
MTGPKPHTRSLILSENASGREQPLDGRPSQSSSDRHDVPRGNRRLSGESASRLAAVPGETLWPEDTGRAMVAELAGGPDQGTGRAEIVIMRERVLRVDRS